MRIKAGIKRLLALRDAPKGHELDLHAAYARHRDIILSKPLLKEIYTFYFTELLKDFGPLDSKKILEIGAGAYNSSEYFPGVITSDIEKNAFVKMGVDAQDMRFGNNELDGIILLETLHHIKRPAVFFGEAERILKCGGLLTLIEPYFSPWGGFIYRHLHHEPVIDTDSWDLPDVHDGRLSGANIITPYNIFVRDRKLFERDFPRLKIERITRHTSFTYLLSGGLSYKCVVPPSLNGFVWGLEKVLRPLNALLATAMTVVIRKTC